MGNVTRIGIIGAGWPGQMHARGAKAAGGFSVDAVADLIPTRRESLKNELKIANALNEAMELINDPKLDAVSICTPGESHVSLTLAALKAGKHVICEKPPALSASELKKVQTAQAKSGKVVLYAMQRRFGASEQAAKQAVEKGYAGEAYHARSVLTRTRGVPRGTGWYTQKSRSGGGAMIDIGIHMLDLGWSLLGQPAPTCAFAVTHQKFRDLVPSEIVSDVEDACFAVVRFEGGKSLELAVSWAINQAPQQNGTVCRVYGDAGAIEVYTPAGATIYRQFAADGKCSDTVLKQPKVFGHTAMLRHFRECILGKATPVVGIPQAMTLMRIIEAIYDSAESGKSVQLAKAPAVVQA